MKRLPISLAVAAVAVFAVAATVAAAGPTPAPTPDQVRARDTIPTVLGLSHDAIMDLRQDGLTLTEIAERQDVDPQKLSDALVAQWSARIDARVANEALTVAEAATLKAQLTVQAKALLNNAELGGMQGAAVGAGPGAAGAARMGNGAHTGDGARMGNGARMGGAGAGSGSGTCDGTGPIAK